MFDRVLNTSLKWAVCVSLLISRLKLMIELINAFSRSPFKCQTHKIVKHTQNNSSANNLASVFDHFVGLALTLAVNYKLTS